MSTLKERMHEALNESGKNQSELAHACGVKPPSVNDWFSGKTLSLKAATAHRAAAFLGVNPLWLSEGRGPKRPGEPVEIQPAEEIDFRSLQLDALRQAVHAMAREFNVTPEELISGNWGDSRQQGRLDLVVENREEPPQLPGNSRHWKPSDGADRRVKERRAAGNRRAAK